jgi:nucleoside-diphosphate-sugar epimerase
VYSTNAHWREKTVLQLLYRRALITGAAGFIGSHLVESILDEGLEVVAIDDLSAGKEENLAHLRSNPKLQFHRVDVCDIDRLAPLFNEVDVVFHQACSKNTVSFANPRRDLEVNAFGTLNMLLCAHQSSVKRFIHASTGSVYGEAQYFPTDEKHLTRPTSYYGVSKLAGEQYVRVFNHLHGLDTVMLRYYHVFGPRQDYSDVGGVVSIFARKALSNTPLLIYGDGTQLRSFTYVDDVVAINRHVAMASGISGEAFNCASGVKVTIQELAEAVCSYYGKNNLQITYADWKPGDIRHFNVSNDKLRSTGFEFQFDFDTGLAQTLDASREYFAKVASEAITELEQNYDFA